MAAASLIAGDGRAVKGTNAQNLVEKIVRQRIFESKYWKEHCFALNGQRRRRGGRRRG